jgi:hypothetical protein
MAWPKREDAATARRRWAAQGSGQSERIKGQDSSASGTGAGDFPPSDVGEI